MSCNCYFIRRFVCLWIWPTARTNSPTDRRMDCVGIWRLRRWFSIDRLLWCAELVFTTRLKWSQRRKQCSWIRRNYNRAQNKWVGIGRTPRRRPKRTNGLKSKRTDAFKEVSIKTNCESQVNCAPNYCIYTVLTQFSLKVWTLHTCLRCRRWFKGNVVLLFCTIEIGTKQWKHHHLLGVVMLRSGVC